MLEGLTVADPSDAQLMELVTNESEGCGITTVPEARQPSGKKTVYVFVPESAYCTCVLAALEVNGAGDQVTEVWVPEDPV